MALRSPFLWLFKLISRGIEDLAEISFAVGQSYRREWCPQIRCGAQRIAGKNAQASAVSRNINFEGNLHRKICHSWGMCFLHLFSFTAGLNLKICDLEAHF